MGGPASSSVETVLLALLIQLIVIIAVARFFGKLFRSIGQPQVCGEIAAGLILGPSFFGKLAPGIFEHIFMSSVVPIFNVLSQLGLILLMFMVGLELDLTHLLKKGRTAIATSFVGIFVPFGLGLLVAQIIYPWVGAGIDRLGFSLIMATALSITAMPVLARIMMELNIHRSPIGTLTMTAAAIDDASGWIILTAVAAIVRSEFNPLHTLLMILETIAFGLVMYLIVGPILRRWVRRTLDREGSDVSLTTLSALMVIVFASATVTNLIGIFSIFGAFVVGAVLSGEDSFREAIGLRLKDFTTAFFLPIFFTYTGLRTDIGSMQGAIGWGICSVIIGAAIAGKLGGCTLAARIAGRLSWKESVTIGILMNTRGLMELIVINLGYDLGIIPRSVFFMLVLMAVVTTYMTTPLVRHAIRNTELEDLVEQSPFILGSRKPAVIRPAP